MSLCDPFKIVEKLTSLPHRGTGTAMEKKSGDIIEKLLSGYGCEVKRQGFKTPNTYIWEVIWLTSLLSVSLLLTPVLTWISVLIITFCTVSSFLYFDWRSSPLSFFAPSVQSENIIGTMEKSRDDNNSSDITNKHLILMAHYDSAPVSLLYLPSMVKNFRSSLIMNLLLIAFALLISILEVLNIGTPITSWIRLILSAYFLIQGVIASFDFFRYGFTNGASDNATGTAAAISTAVRLWEKPVPGIDVSVVLTGAEEAGMTGSKYYFTENEKSMNPDNTCVLNFDSLGNGGLKIITKTGSLTTISYEGKLLDAAIQTSRKEKFSSVEKACWHTGDFDSIWFARAGIPSLTLTAQDEKGSIPNLHRPEDTIENIDISLTEFTIDFAESLIRDL